MGNLNCQSEKNKAKLVYMAKIFSIKLLVLLLSAEGGRKLGEERGIYLTDGRGCLVILPLSALLSSDKLCPALAAQLWILKEKLKMHVA